jgi:hypothetical protein
MARKKIPMQKSEQTDQPAPAESSSATQTPPDKSIPPNIPMNLDPHPLFEDLRPATFGPSRWEGVFDL